MQKKFLTILLVVLSIAGKSQQLGMKPDIVAVKFPKPNLYTQSLPFDDAFVIEGDIGEEYESVVMQYKIRSEAIASKRWISFPPKVEPDGYYTSGELKVVNKKVSVPCPGLHPNIKYEFKFSLRKRVIGDDNFRNALKAKIGKALSQFFQLNANTALLPTDISRLQTDIDNLIRQHLELTPTDVLYLRGTPDLYTTDFNIMLGGAPGVVMTRHNAIKNAKDNLDNTITGIPIAKTHMANRAQDFSTTIEQFLVSPDKATTSTKELLKLPVAPFISEYKDYTFADGLSLFKRITADPMLYNQILDGALKLHNNQLVPSEGRHAPTIHLITAIMQKLEDGKLQQNDGNATVTHFQQSRFDRIFEKQRLVSSELAIIEANEKGLAKSLEDIPDVTAKIIILQTVTEEVITMPDVVSSKTPYISVEAGLGYTSVFQSAFSYYGANFYLSPVNKKAPLQNFKGWNKFKKMFCFQVGVAQFYGNRPENTFSLLGGDSQDLVLGAGLRLFKTVKLNTGVIPFKTNNNNPLSDNFDIRYNGFISAGIDVDLLGALGKVANLLKL